MAAKYDFYKNPAPDGSENNGKYHARVVPNGTVTPRELAKKIQSRCTASTADVAAVLTSLADVMVDELKEGRRIHIAGIGYLTLTLKCPETESPNGIRAESIRFKSIAFRPEARLKEQLAHMEFERVKTKRHSSQLSEAGVDELLTRHFSTHPYLTRLEFERLCGYTPATANRKLKSLYEQGKLANINRKQYPLFEAAPGYYGKEALHPGEAPAG